MKQGYPSKLRPCISKSIEKALFIVLTERTLQVPGKTKKVKYEIPIPRTYKDAVNDPKHGDNWLEAINEEVKSLVKNGI